MVNRPYPKLAFKFYGPFRILEKVRALAYKLDLPQHSLIHPVFHISQLKGYTQDFTPVFSELPPPQLDSQETSPEQILDRRLVKKGNAAIPQVLIKWKDIPATSATWEDYYACKQCFPDAIAWGQAISIGGDDVTHAVLAEDIVVDNSVT